jgi:olfactory receptor
MQSLNFSCLGGGAAHSFPQFSIAITLPFCGPSEIDHTSVIFFLCWRVPVLILPSKVSLCMPIVTLVTFVVLFVSYVIILFTLRNHSAEGRWKALSTYGSHITVIVLVFGPAIFSYLRPPTTFPEDKVFALLYTIIAPNQYHFMNGKIVIRNFKATYNWHPNSLVQKCVGNLIS